MEDRLNKYIGIKYGHLTITGIDRNRMSISKSRLTYVFADCDCGICGKSYTLEKLKRGETRSCGHLKHQHGRQRKFNNIDFFDTYGIIYCKDTPFYFDIEDFPLLDGKYWYEDNHGYLKHAYTINGKTFYEKFHNVVMGIPEGSEYLVDHKNRKPNDNRKSNLRICLHKENDRNNNLYKNNSSGFTGVSFDKSRNKWVARIMVDRKDIFLGRYDKIQDAIKARLIGELNYFGDFSPQSDLFEDYLSREEIEEEMYKNNQNKEIKNEY